MRMGKAVRMEITGLSLAARAQVAVDPTEAEKASCGRAACG